MWVLEVSLLLTLWLVRYKSIAQVRTVPPLQLQRAPPGLLQEEGTSEDLPTPTPLRCPPPPYPPPSLRGPSPTSSSLRAKIQGDSPCQGEAREDSQPHARETSQVHDGQGRCKEEAGCCTAKTPKAEK
jgi:hypothetical protein